jgi:hypothetical protein
MLRHLALLTRVFSIFIIGSVLFASPVFAAEVAKIKGKSALIDLKGEPAAPGDMFYALSDDGKRRGIIKISKVKGDKAIGKIVKGKADVGMSLELRPASGGKSSAVAASDSGDSPTSDDSAAEGKKMHWGAIFGITQTSMKAQVNDFDDSTQVFGSTSMTGMSYSAKGLFDYELFPRIWFRGSSGLEGVDVSGSSICGSGNNNACTAQIWYLSFDFLGRYVFAEPTAKWRPWAGAGVEMLFPLSKKASALNTKTITTTSVMLVSGGVDWQLSPKYYIPISLEYGIFPSSSEVKANWIGVRAGFAIPF